MWKTLGIPLIVATFVGTIHGSVIFPLDHNELLTVSSRPHHSRTRRLARRHREYFQRRNHSFSTTDRRNVFLTTTMHKGVGSLPLAFTPLQAGKFLSVAALIGCIGKKLQSESFTRALYFWIHAGPVVMHYKFTRWYLTKTKAPLEKRDIVYNTLHDKYCDRCLNIALQLKGLYVKVCNFRSWYFRLFVPFIPLSSFSFLNGRLPKLFRADLILSLHNILNYSLVFKIPYHKHP